MVNNRPDYYSILGIERDAEQDEIKRAYRRLARLYHPDLNPGDDVAAEKFKDINEAYDVLSDATKKERYDRGEDPEFGAGTWDEGGFDEFVNAAFHDEEDPIATAKRKRAPRRGEDIDVPLRITLEEAVKGCSKVVEVMHEAICPECEGSGAAFGTKPVMCDNCKGQGIVRREIRGMGGRPFTQTKLCPKCRGEGRIIMRPCSHCRGLGRAKAKTQCNISVPRGVDEGHKLILKGAGNCGYNGGPAGDVRVVISIRPHATYKRDNLNIRSTHIVSFYQAAMGGLIEVPTLSGKRKIHIPAGTQNGDEFIIEKAGAPDLDEKEFGDHIVTIQVDVPRHLTPRQKEALRRFQMTLAETED